MESFLGLLIGIGLSATCGFRIFVPLLGIAIAHQTDHLTLSPGFEWIGSEIAIIVFLVASVLEIMAYYIPWVDNVLDSIATPSAIIAGTILTASVVGDVSPVLRWSLAIIAGGGTSAIVQGSTQLIRVGSTATTGGIGNPLISTGELSLSFMGTFLAIFFPVFTFVAVIFLLIFLLKTAFNRDMNKTDAKLSFRNSP